MDLFAKAYQKVLELTSKLVNCDKYALELKLLLVSRGAEAQKLMAANGENFSIVFGDDGGYEPSPYYTSVGFSAKGLRKFVVRHGRVDSDKPASPMEAIRYAGAYARRKPEEVLPWFLKQLEEAKVSAKRRRG